MWPRYNSYIDDKEPLAAVFIKCIQSHMYVYNIIMYIWNEFATNQNNIGDEAKIDSNTLLNCKYTIV